MTKEIIPTNEIKEKINYITGLKDIPDRHSFYQLQCFVIGKENTSQAKMRQCILELKSRIKNIEAIELEIAEQEDNLELANLDIQEIKLNCEKRELIRIRKLNRKKQSIVKQIEELSSKLNNIKEECLFIIELFNKLNIEEPLHNWDDLDVQKEYWNEKLRNEINIRVLLNSPIDPELLKTILALHDDAPVKRKTIELLQLSQVSKKSISEK